MEEKRKRDDKGRFIKGNKEGQKFHSGGNAAEAGRRGGIASGETKRYAKTFGEALRKILDEPATAGGEKSRREVICEKLIYNLYNNPTIKDMKIAAELMGELEQNINVNHTTDDKPVINIISRRPSGE
jgi:hypothetical protein